MRMLLVLMPWFAKPVVISGIGSAGQLQAQTKPWLLLLSQGKLEEDKHTQLRLGALLHLVSLAGVRGRNRRQLQFSAASDLHCAARRRYSPTSGRHTRSLGFVHRHSCHG